MIYKETDPLDQVRIILFEMGYSKPEINQMLQEKGLIQWLLELLRKLGLLAS